MKPYHAFLGYLSLASATKHHLFVGTFSQASLYALEFDDETLDLTLANNITAAYAHPWISLSHDKKALYAVGDGYWYSYNVDNSTGLDLTSSVNITGNCTTGGDSAGADAAARGIFIVGAPEAPYKVYANIFGICANAMSVDQNGALDTVIQNISFSSDSGVHGLAITPDNSYLYATDDSANKIWTYSINKTTGLLHLLNTISGPETDSNPRHASVHPSGETLFVVLEETNKVAEYHISSNGLLSDTNNITSYPLITPGLSTSNYWSDEVKVSPSGKYLWASSRARDSNTTGFLSAFSLSPKGRIEKQLFLLNTTTSGGTANSVAPAFFSDEFVALTDTVKEFVQIWRFGNDTAEVVAQITLADGGCCANAVWYD